LRRAHPADKMTGFMLFLTRAAATATMVALLATATGCRRPEPSLAGNHPGVDPKPSGRTLSEDAPMSDPERPTIDLTRPESMERSIAPASENDTAYEAAIRGEAWAQTKVGKSYVASPDDADRFRQGLDFLRRAAEQDDAEAIYLLATLTATGTGVPPSNIEAYLLMKRAAELGFTEAYFALGTMYFQGRGTVRDEVAALSSFRRAADGGHQEALLAAGRIMLAQPDPEMQAEGLGLMERAIESGHIRATLMLAEAYRRGENGLPKDEAKAEAVLKPAAERGDADCQMALASLYKFGESFAERRDEAQGWLQRAADQGHPNALEILQAEER
jgi:TPR repeat protein